MKSTILFALLIGAVSVRCNPIQVQGNNIGDIVTVSLNFNGVLSAVVDEENVKTDVGLKSKGPAPAVLLDTTSQGSLPVPSDEENAILAAQPEAGPYSRPNDVQDQSTARDAQVEEQIQKAIGHLLRNLQK